ncbi:cation diffusion facilitator family transporter [Mumia flava]|uniref:cation diffusion facilitator family transporter n=1 Tax=Mumia flava TaxID=1348852 RepID=UPI000A6733AF|nr:cation diffusion facilitator family transporter [Mumia flava]
MDATRHAHSHGHGHAHSHGHSHAHGVRAWLKGVFVPHSHDVSDSIDDALQASRAGIRAVKVSLVLLGLTAAAQLVIVVVSGSVALLADTIHNVSDALTAIPLWIAFVLARRPASPRYPYGFGRAEDLAGLFVVAMIALSALVAGVESVRRLADPQPLEHLGWVAAAGVVGFAGNEAVAVLRIRVGRRIGSAALVADGVHARADGFTSLAVVIGAGGVWAGFPLADPIVGLVITAAIVVLLAGTARDVGRRLLDGVDPGLVAQVEQALVEVPDVERTTDVRLRWSGHRLLVQVSVAVSPGTSVAAADAIAGRAAAAVRRALPSAGRVDITTTPSAAA